MPEQTKKLEVGTAVPSSRSELGTRIFSLLRLYDSKIQASKVAKITPEQLTRYERGLNIPAFDVLARLASEKGVDLNWLATGEGEMLVKDRTVDGKVDESLLSDAIEAVEEHLAGNNLHLEPAKKALLIRELIMIIIEDEESDRVKITGKLSRLVRLAT